MLGRLLRVAAAIGVLGSASSVALADPVNNALANWTVDQGVNVTYRVGNTLYFGGGFTHLAPERNTTGNFVVLSPTSGGAVLTPRISGDVESIVPDGNGGYYIGGRFTGVNGVARSNLAHLLADGSLDHLFAAAPNNSVNAMVLVGSVLYLGGDFTDVSGQPRTRLAAVNTGNGSLATWAPTVDGSVSTMVVSGANIYVGGSFSQAGGSASYRHAAAFNTTGALQLGWLPDPNSNVYSMTLVGTTIYMGGLFSSVGGAQRGGLAAVSLASGAVQPWAPPGDNIGQSIAVSGTKVFASGVLSGGAVTVAAYDSVSGVPVWTVATLPAGPVGLNVQSLVIDGGQLYVGGSFTAIDGAERGHLATLSTATGAVLSFNPMMNNQVLAMVMTSAGLAVGGQFTAHNATPRGHAAAVDLSTGRLLPWNPNFDRSVYALARVQGTMLVGGAFRYAGSEMRQRLAAVTLDTGMLLPWNPGADNTVSLLVPAGSSIIVGGGFGTIGGQPRAGLAMLDPLTGTPTAWNPSPNNSPSSLVVSGSTAYVSGLFTSIGGQPRSRLAQVALTGTGLATAWDPSPNGWVVDVQLLGTTLYIAGDFTAVGTVARTYLAAVDAVAGTVLPWNPNPNARVTRLSSARGLVYAGGDFTMIGGQVRSQLAALNATTAAVSPWAPSGGQRVTSLEAARDGVVVGSSRRTNNLAPFLEVFPEPLPAIPGPPADVASFSAGSSLSIQWSEPAIGGRPTNYVIEAGSSPGGTNLANFSTGSTATSFSTAGVPPGTYYVRVRAANAFGRSRVSDEIAINIGPSTCSTVEAPVDFSHTVSGNVANFAWRPLAGRIPAAYVLEAGSASGLANLARFDTGAPVTSLSLGAPPGQFYVRLRARDGCGLSRPSNEIVVAVGTGGPPGAPLGVTGTVTGNSVQLAWSPPLLGGVSAYVLEAGSGPGLSNVLVTNVGGGLSFVTAGVPNGVYYVRMRALGTNGSSVASNEVTLIVP